MILDPVDGVRVGLRFGDETLPVGHLTLQAAPAGRARGILFEYDAGFIRRGMDISPLKCRLEPGGQSFRSSPFNGLPGVFADSLPDGWGRLLLDCEMKQLGVRPSAVSPLDRLCYAGDGGMGALVYEPVRTAAPPSGAILVEDLAARVDGILSGRVDDVRDGLLRRLNGSSAGARPKAMLGLDADGKNALGGTEPPPGYEPWLVKFPNKKDGADAGALEYVYAVMAERAGIRMPPTRLLPSSRGPGYFAVKRFDRVDGGRLHMHTACGLLHTDFRIPALDYSGLIALTKQMTGDDRETERMYRLAVFNALTHNRDDHAKNFSFLMDRDGVWTLSPAYDLTFSSGINHEHSTAVMGEGKRPTREHLLSLAREARVPDRRANEILDRTRGAAADFRPLAAQHDVSRERIEAISRRLAEVERDGEFAASRSGTDMGL